MSNLPPPGDHPAKIKGKIQIGEASTGSLCITIPCFLPQSENFTCEWLGVLVKSDGTVMTNTLDNLKEVFSWDGQDPFWLTEDDRDFSELEFSLGQCTHEEYEGKTRFKPGFLNSSARRIQLKEVSRKDVLAKYGSKFRALSGGKTVTPPKPPAKTPVKKIPPAAPTGPTATLQETWQAFTENHESKDQKILNTAWFARLEAEYPGKDQADLTPQEWGALKEKITDNVPQ